jgi:hypothetical protein
MARLAGVAVDDLLGPTRIVLLALPGVASVLALHVGSLPVCREAWSA